MSATNLEATLHIRLDSSLKADIEKIATSFSVKPAVIVREALERYVEANPQPSTSKINLDNF